MPAADIVKNSWGTSFGMKGYINMKRNVNKTGICGIAMQASYPTVSKKAPMPIPPPTPGKQPGVNDVREPAAAPASK